MSQLSELLTKHKPKGWSNRQVAREAQKRGHVMSEPTATAYLGGRHGTPTDELMEAFADTLGIPLIKVRHAAGVRVEVGDPWEPPASARYLRDDQRLALERLIATMITREEGGEERDHSSPATTTPAPGPADQPGTRHLSAARTEVSKGKKRRKEIEDVGEGSQDDGGMGPA